MRLYRTLDRIEADVMCAALKPMQPSPPVIVLVEPQNPANLGFVARIADNFGFGEVRVLGGCSWEHSKAKRTGSSAKNRLASFHAVHSWEEASEGCSHLVGFTARAGKKRAPISLDDWQPELNCFGPNAQPALVFGREDRGLESNEVDRCHLLVSIPTTCLGSLNLSHAIAVAGYAWRQWAGGTRMPTPPGTGPSNPATAGPVISSQADRMRFLESVGSDLQDLGIRDDPEELSATLRRLARLPIETRDLRILDRALRHVRWRREDTNGKD
ncbi:MAG: RNA methyltransferase [Planctomycetes bacterium]|nr:RNA methyltransferase [Planctomycetota bacterium]